MCPTLKTSFYREGPPSARLALVILPRAKDKWMTKIGGRENAVEEEQKENEKHAVGPLIVRRCIICVFEN